MIKVKPKFWDLKKPNYLSYLLLPFTIPIILNNYFLSFKKKRNIGNIKTICLGNIYVGGTAKTPLTIKLNQILRKLNFKTASIKKFYKSQIDEQKLLADKSILYCNKNRKNALRDALNNNIDVAIFDDGLQDRYLTYDISFVCFSSANWIGNGFLIPSGPLREKLKSVQKYDAIFLTGNEENNSHIKDSLRKIDKGIKIFETYYKPTNINQFNNEDAYLIFSGIGDPDNFKKTLLKYKLNIVKEMKFSDHYQYKLKDLSKIKSIAAKLNAKIITTEKDFVKIPQGNRDKIKFLEIDLVIKKQDELISFIKSKI